MMKRNTAVFMIQVSVLWQALGCFEGVRAINRHIKP